MTVIATWNVNSVRARLPRVLEWLDEFEPDVALLQELKATDETFPRLEIEDHGYNVEIHGQKNFNGVAILSKLPIEDVGDKDFAALGHALGLGDSARWLSHVGTR